MGTSSAKPLKLFGYRDAALQQVEAWEAEVEPLREALSQLRSSLAGLDLPDDCTLTVPEHETTFDNTVKDQRHLDEWVGDVGMDFVLSDPALFWANPTGTMTADDSRITVGYPDRARSEQQAREDAEAIQRILGETGLVDPSDILAADFETLDELADLYPELRDILERSARFGNDENYAVTLVNALGPEDVRTLVDLTNTFGMAHDRDLLGGDPYANYVVPLAGIIAAADRSGRMADDVHDAIFDMDATDEVDMEGSTYGAEESIVDAMRTRSLTLVLTAGGDSWAPETKADLVDTILAQPEVDRLHGIQGWGFTDAAFLEDHRPLASNDWAAYDAIADDPLAANVFYSMDDGENLSQAMDWLTGGYETGRMTGLDVAEGFLGSDSDVFSEMLQTGADSVHGGLLEHPLAAGTTYHQDTVDLVTQAIELTGEDDRSLSDEMRLSMAQVSSPYTLDIAIAAESYDPTGLPTEDQVGRPPLGLSEDDVERFMREIVESEDARMMLSQNAAAFAQDQIGSVGSGFYAPTTRDPMGTANRLAVGYYVELGGAFDAVLEDEYAKQEALLAGRRSLTDPLVDLVSGQIVDRVPGISSAKDLPIASQVVDGITGEIESGLNDGLDRLFDDEPEFDAEAMVDWTDAARASIREATVEALYSDTAAREHYLRESGRDPNAPITVEEFLQLPLVMADVNSHASEIGTAVEARLAHEDESREPS